MNEAPMPDTDTDIDNCIFPENVHTNYMGIYKMTWWNLTEVVEWQLNKNSQLNNTCKFSLQWGNPE